ncbi:MAG: dynamin family protein [Lachnospiraceae bacterium]|nr:dynamin family protein [Lachnospiraceae bacterium]
MEILQIQNTQFTNFMEDVQNIICNLSVKAKQEDIAGLEQLIANFRLKTEDFFREERKLNIGVVGQVKAGKSSFLNTLLFDGQEILPKASTPKTATLTKMEYAEENIIRIEYYTEDEWSVLEENAGVDLDDEIYTSAREIVSMVRKNGVDPHKYLQRKKEEIRFDTYEDLIAHLNDYVGEDGKFTPIVKAVTLFLHKKEFEGLSIVDTPGLNDPIASRTIRTKEFMEVCDVVFFLSQSGSFLDKSDWILLSSQLPQNGVKRLVLIASKYDSGVRDVLRMPTEEDDIFGEDENTADNIPKAGKIIERKLRRRAKAKVEEFIRDLQARGSSRELIEVISECSEPILVSSMAYNMSKKNSDDYSAEENNVASALKLFSSDLRKDLRQLGNFEAVQKVFDEVVREKEAILEKRAKGFIPDAEEKLRTLLMGYKEKAQKRLDVLSGNDRENLIEQRRLIEGQIGSVKADITVVFSELSAKLESRKAEGVRELRSASKDYSNLKEYTGSKTVQEAHTVSDSKWYKPWTWGKSHTEYTTRTEHYSYCVASDAIDNLRKYAMEATNQIEEVFTEAIQVKEIKRKLLDVVIRNFDMGSEKYDSSIIRIMVEEVVSAIEFPVFQLDFSDAMNGIAGRFTGRLTSASERTALVQAQAKAISGIYDELSTKLTAKVKELRESMNAISRNLQDSLLAEMNKEFEMLIQECENKDAEIAAYQAYIELLEHEMAKR